MAVKNTIPKGLRHYCNKILEGHIHHYSQVFHAKPSFLLLWLMDKLFSKVRIPSSIIEQIRDMAEEGQVIYFIKYRNMLEFLFFHFSFQRLGLPVPQSAFYLPIRLLQPVGQIIRILINQLCYFFENLCLADPFKNGYFQHHLENNGSLMVFLIDSKYGYKRLITPNNDPITILLNHQFTSDRPIFLVPLMLLFSKKPLRMHKSFFDIFFGPIENPGFLRTCFLFLKNFNKATVNMGTPINLQEWQKEAQSQGIDQPFELRKNLIQDLDIHRKVITGPIQKSRQQLMEIVLREPALVKMMEEKAARESKPIQAIRREAYGYISEIAADYKISYVMFFEKILTWIFNNLFDGIRVDPDSLATIKNIAKKAPLVYIPCHKSHIDYLVLSYILLHNNLMIPHVAAGRNLNFWPVAPLFRHSGAFFIRRSFVGMELYAKVFDVYLQTLIKEGYPLEFFIEGGRSRTGKLVQPKLGLLSMLMQSIENKVTDELFFVPTYIQYDRIIEESSYIRELSGEKKEKENFGQLIRARKFLKKRYGNIFIKFAAPISLKEYMKGCSKDLAEMDKTERKRVYRDFSYKIIRSINEISVITPSALSAAAILSLAKKGFEIEDYLHVGRLFFDYFQERSISISPAISETEPETSLIETLTLYESRNIIKRMEDDEDESPFFYMDEDKRMYLEYYKNNIIHFLLPISMLSLCILSKESFSFKPLYIEQDIEMLIKLFRFEFVYPDPFSPSQIVQEGLEYMIKRGFIIKENEATYQITHTGLRELSYFSELIQNYMESYLVVLRSIKYLNKGPLPQREFLKKITSNGERLFKGEVIKHKEALSKANYQNAINFLLQEGILFREGVRKGNRIIIRVGIKETKVQLVKSWQQFIDCFLLTS